MLTEFAGEANLVPPPRHRGGHVLFLDYDGVTHPGSVYYFYGRGPVLVDAPGHTLFENIALLEAVLAPYPEIRIVLSTSWVRLYRGSIARVAGRLSPALRARVIGATYHSKMDRGEFAAMPRGMQIWQDVLRRQPAAWLALDDDYEHWPHWCVDQLVRTDPELGISAPTVLAEFEAKLYAMHVQAG